MKTKAVLLDKDGTLMEFDAFWRTASYGALEDLLRGLGGDLSAVGELLSALGVGNGATDITGALCCLAGGGAVLLSGYLPLGAVLIAALAVPVAWLQYGGESAFIMAVGASIMLTRHWAGLQRMRRGEEPQFFRKWHY